MGKRVRRSFLIQLLESYPSPSEPRAKLKPSIPSTMVGDTVGIGEGEEQLLILSPKNERRVSCGMLHVTELTI